MTEHLLALLVDSDLHEVGRDVLCLEIAGLNLSLPEKLFF